MEQKQRGRPKIEIDKNEFEKLCALQCTLTEIAEWFKCSEDTIERWCKRTYSETFADTYKKKSAKGKISLRRKQFEVANAGNVSMLIWLGRNWLDQKDDPGKLAVNLEIEDLTPLAEMLKK